MEATIRTNNSNAFYSLVQFLRTLHFEVETKEGNDIQESSRKKLLDTICKGGDGKSIPNPQSWQRKIRKDRKLPFEKSEQKSGCGMK